MQLDELKKNMSTLEQVLAKTNSDIKINVSASETAQAKILKRFRQGIISCIILAVVFAAMILGNINPVSLPVNIKIYLVSYLTLGAIWYTFMYFKLKRINIAALSPAELFSKTATMRLLMLSGEVFLGIGVVVLFTLLLPYMWTFNRIGFWFGTSTIAAAVIYSIVHIWPLYINLFRELNSLK